MSHFEPSNLLYCFIGVFLGTLVGVLPGIGPLATISLLLPLTFNLDPTAAIVMLSGVYYGSAYGGSTAAILLNLPGTPSSAVTCMDGHAMSQKGRAGVALLMTAIASFVGGSLGIVMLTVFAPTIAAVGLQFGPAEYVAAMIVGLVAASTVASGAPLKGIAMVVLGVLLGTVGTDVDSGVDRFTLGFFELSDGVSLVVVAMGLFGVAEVVTSVRARLGQKITPRAITFRSMVPTREDVTRSWAPMLRGSTIGSFLGAIPGMGGVAASFMAYAAEKKIARQPERFGNGAVEGVASPEAANNAADQTAFIPLLTLGIPGNGVTAVLIGALMIHGIAPGPQLILEKPDLFWGLIMSFWIGNVILMVLNIPLIGLWIRVLAIPYHLLYPAILSFVCLGVFSIRNSVFDVFAVLLFGAVGYVLRLLHFHPAPLLLGLVLGPMLEENLRRALLLSQGDFGVLVASPISATFTAITAILLVWAIWAGLRRNKRPDPLAELEVDEP